MKITVLFCQKNTVYKKLNCDTYDKKRNALNFSGRAASIHHPPCRLWSRLRKFSTADEYEKYFGLWSVRHIQNNGGILEHPASSSLFACANLPKPNKHDEYGFTIEIDQFHFGHKARKRTWLYICGLPDQKDEILKYRKIPGKPRYSVSSSTSKLIEIKKHERDATPIRFAKYLVKICTKINNLKTSKIRITDEKTEAQNKAKRYEGKRSEKETPSSRHEAPGSKPTINKNKNAPALQER